MVMVCDTKELGLRTGRTMKPEKQAAVRTLLAGCS